MGTEFWHGNHLISDHLGDRDSDNIKVAIRKVIATMLIGLSGFRNCILQNQLSPYVTVDGTRGALWCSLKGGRDRICGHTTYCVSL